MNPKPSLPQVLVLHEVADGTVWFDMVTGKWHTTYGRGNASVQVDILHRNGYVNIVDDVITLTPMGKQVLDRRPYAEVVEKLNGG
jgi:hypothetical protein